MKVAMQSRVARSLRRPAPRIAHSQIINTRQPADFNISVALRSRCALARSFAFQKSWRVSGSLDSEQRCACQKQPWMNTTVRYFGKTRSGLPGSERSCNRYHNPRACTPRRISISGFVSLPRMRLMLSWRCAAVSTSAIHAPAPASATMVRRQVRSSLPDMPGRSVTAPKRNFSRYSGWKSRPGTSVVLKSACRPVGTCGVSR